MTDEQILEYEQLRGEYILLAQMMSTAVTYSVGGTIAIFSFITSSSTPFFVMFGFALLVIFPACYILISRIQSIIRIAAYIRVFLEPNSDLKYETRYLKFAAFSTSKLKFSSTVLLIYFGLLVIDIVLFVAKGFTSHSHILFYLLSLILYIHVCYLMTRDWRGHYISLWEKVKSKEVSDAQ